MNHTIRKFTRFLLIAIMAVSMYNCGGKQNSEQFNVLRQTFLDLSVWKDVSLNDSIIKLAESILTSENSDPMDQYYAYMILGYKYNKHVETDSALHYFINAENLAHDFKQSKYKALALRGQARSLTNTTLNKEALSIIKESTQILQKLDDSVQIAINFHIYGGILDEIGSLDSAFYYLTRSLKIIEKSNEKHLLSRIYNAIGGYYIGKHDHLNGEIYLRKAEKISREIKSGDQLVQTLINIGVFYKDRQMLDSARYFYNEVDKITQMYPDLILYKIQKDYNLCNLMFEEKHYKEAYDTYKQINKECIAKGILPGIVRTEVQMAACLIAMDKDDEGMAQLKKTLKFSLDSHNIEYAEFCQTGIMEGISHQLRNTKYAKDIENYIHFQDSLENWKPIKEIAKMETLFKLNNTKDQLNKAKLKDAEKHKKFILWFWISFTLVLSSAFITFYERQKKRNAELRHTATEEKNRAFQLELEKQIAISEMKEAESEALKVRNRIKKQEIANLSLAEMEKKNILQNILNEIEFQTSLMKNPETLKVLENIGHIINKINDEGNLAFLERFKDLHPDFINKLNHLHPNLSLNDIRICSMVYMNLSNKEIANILNVQNKSVEMSKYRIRKKLELNGDDSLDGYLKSLV